MEIADVCRRRGASGPSAVQLLRKVRKNLPPVRYQRYVQAAAIIIQHLAALWGPVRVSSTAADVGDERQADQKTRLTAREFRL